MKLIDADEVKKRFPIMENDFGMVVNETLHKELDKIPTVKAIPLEKLKDFRNEVMNMNSYAIIHRLDKLIEEVEDAKAGDHERTI
jgi:predicted Ser/Thr protein kinase